MGDKLKEDVERLTTLLDANAERNIKAILENLGVLVKKRGRVALVDSENNLASVYFDGDTNNMSCLYKNCTGEELSVGDIVYVFCQYNKDAQG